MDEGEVLRVLQDVGAFRAVAYVVARLEAVHEGRSYGMLRTVDLNVNCRVHRQQGNLKIHTEPRPLSGGKLPFKARKEGES